MTLSYLSDLIQTMLHLANSARLPILAFHRLISSLLVDGLFLSITITVEQSTLFSLTVFFHSIMKSTLDTRLFSSGL